MRVGIIGCGKIGQKRATAINGSNSEIVAVSDIDESKIVELIRNHPVHGCYASADWRDVVSRKDIDAIIVATPHNMLAAIAKDALDAGKHVLIEKPGAINLNALEPLFHYPKQVVRVGYNMRFHPAVIKAQELLHEIGEVMYVRGYYGHGGRPGYEKEWRFDVAQSGGGVVMDLGVHLIDLSNLFLSVYHSVKSTLDTSFWKTTLEDNASFVITDVDGRCAYLQVSCTEWRNEFWFEIVGRTGKLCINGLGGSYGDETLTLYRMTPAMGKPETTAWGFVDRDTSWGLEWANFEASVEGKAASGANVHDAGWVLDVVEEIYDNYKIAT